MNQRGITIEDLLPHRERMKLINRIIEMDEEKAVTISITSGKWPFSNGQGVSSLVLVELVAQTAGVSNGWSRLQKEGKNSDKKGWIVGIKKTRFFIDEIPLDTSILTCTENIFKFDNFVEIKGIAEIDHNPAGEVVLQLFKSNKNRPEDSRF